MQYAVENDKKFPVPEDFCKLTELSELNIEVNEIIYKLERKYVPPKDKTNFIIT